MIQGRNIEQGEQYKQMAEKQAAWAYQDSARNAYINPSLGGGAIAGANSAQGLVADRNEGGVLRGIRHMEKNIAVLASTVEALAERLALVRVPYPTAKSEGTKAPEGSGLASVLSGYNDSLEYQTGRLQQLIQELDL